MAKRILIIGPAWVGDMVMSQTLYRLLKAQDPQVELHVLAPKSTLPLLARMPEINAGIAMPLGHGQWGWAVRRQLGKELHQGGYDQAIVLPNSFKSALAPFWARIPQRTGWQGECRWGVLNDRRRLNKQQLPLMIQRFAALGLPAQAPLPQDLPHPRFQADPTAINAVLAQFQLDLSAGPVLALCPGAEYGPAKRWPGEYFAQVARDRLAQGWQVWILGGPKDRSVAQDINEAAGGQCRNLAGETGLLQAVDLLAKVQAVLTNDSGLMHVAAAWDRPLVALYGSSTPQFTPPLTQKARILSLELDCSPCFKRTCPLGHTRCLWDLKPQQVLDVLQEWAV